ncbi:MAG: hypothetical protein ACYTAN_13225 [Planctomycetota bacterium]|jgi:hypothetical protein
MATSEEVWEFYYVRAAGAGLTPVAQGRFNTRTWRIVDLTSLPGAGTEPDDMRPIRDFAATDGGHSLGFSPDWVLQEAACAVIAQALLKHGWFKEKPVLYLYMLWFDGRLDVKTRDLKAWARWDPPVRLDGVAAPEWLRFDIYHHKVPSGDSLGGSYLGDSGFVNEETCEVKHVPIM